MKSEVEKSCSHCGEKLHGKYCHACGQKLVEEKDKKLSAFFEQLFASLFYADGKFFKTFKTMYCKPGEMSNRYIKGIRKRYFNPLQLFFFVNLIYFLFPVINTFNTNLSSHLSHQVYSESVKQVVEHYLEDTDIRYQDFREDFEQSAAQYAKLLLILMVFFHALTMKVLFINRKELYFTDFLATSAYFAAFYILNFLILLPGIIIQLNKLFSDGVTNFININENLVSIVVILILILFLSVFLKRAFQLKNTEAIAKSPLLAISLVPAFILYRYVLFWVTYWSVT
ncbi:MAG: DUF3667 domain-containing protein [Vicingaceae bacterium]